MRDIDSYPKVYLQTGDCFLGVQPTLVNTVLGSCVAVTMHTPVRGGIGAICHAFLPDSSLYRSQSKDPQVCRFVDTALENMLSSFLRLKITPEDLAVKVFGGASCLLRGDNCTLYEIGRLNVDAVHKRLAEYGIRPVRTACGGRQGRRLMFLTHTGDVWVKLLHSYNKGK